ncbi:426_t:CDS:2 [Paraglomus brasilianum]|uniref:Cytochrome c oxidase assembly protein COX20, mitochondrial n=1 Tax=Paraglomus brasilianum TaxID=144538 RepID=A0A9N8VCS8_9GLOM|nr:426_t:CDS:2 [Paraglomus brasilianum]
MPQNAESTTTANAIPNEHNDPGLTQGPFWAVLKKLSIDDFKNTGQIPCARNSILSGIGGGALFGIMRLLHSGNVAFATQTALGSCCLIGVGAW